MDKYQINIARPRLDKARSQAIWCGRGVPHPIPKHDRSPVAQVRHNNSRRGFFCLHNSPVSLPVAGGLPMSRRRRSMDRPHALGAKHKCSKCHEWKAMQHFARCDRLPLICNRCTTARTEALLNPGRDSARPEVRQPRQTSGDAGSSRAVQDGAIRATTPAGA